MGARIRHAARGGNTEKSNMKAIVQASPGGLERREALVSSPIALACSSTPDI